MKGFIIVIFIFSLMLGGIFFGKAKLGDETDKLLEQVKAIQADPPSAEDMVVSVREKWESAKDIIQISATHRRVETVTDLIDELEAYIKHGSRADLQKAAELLINALEEIKQFEEFSAVNIL